MFGLGMQEILVILAIALIVIGPKKLPELAKTLGRAMGEFKRSAQDFKRSIDVESTVKDFVDIEKQEASLRDVIKDTRKNEAKEETFSRKEADYPNEDEVPNTKSDIKTDIESDLKSELKNDTQSSSNDSNPSQTPSDISDNKS